MSPLLDPPEAAVREVTPRCTSQQSVAASRWLPRRRQCDHALGRNQAPASGCTGKPRVRRLPVERRGVRPQTARRRPSANARIRDASAQRRRAGVLRVRNPCPQSTSHDWHRPRVVRRYRRADRLRSRLGRRAGPRATARRAQSRRLPALLQRHRVRITQGTPPIRGRSVALVTPKRRGGPLKALPAVVSVV